MIVTTTPSLDNSSVDAYLGVVHTTVYYGSNPVQVLSQMPRNLGRLIRGQKVDHPAVLKWHSAARAQAIAELIEQAHALKADAIVNLELSVHPFQQYVTADGTAVRLSPKT